MHCSSIDLLLIVLCLALYCNTWSAEFAFDDNFAVVSSSLFMNCRCTMHSNFSRAAMSQLYNGDVTGSTPVLSIFKHDFW